MKIPSRLDRLEAESIFIFREAAATADISLLHILTRGSVDDGKSTLLGRLLFDSNAVLDDQLSALDRDSRRFGTKGQARDFALLADGLTAEREQGTTIDVVYRYFSTERRSFIVADTPGADQYTRNMATGASTADLAIILIDARKGVLPQTLRHSYIVLILGVRQIVLAVNKMDLIGFYQDRFHEIVAAYKHAVRTLGFTDIPAIPIRAREGDNVASRSTRTPWHGGPVLLDHLETVDIDLKTEQSSGFRLPMQFVNRPNQDFRGYAGTVTSGVVHVNQPVTVMPSGGRSRIARMVTENGERDYAVPGEAVTLTLMGDIDISHGDVTFAADDALSPVSGASARLLRTVLEPITIGRNFLVRIGSATSNAWVTGIRHKIDIQTFEACNATALSMNEIALVDLAFDTPQVAAVYRRDRELGALILVDRMTNQTVALGGIEALSDVSQISVIGPAAAAARQIGPSRLPRVVAVQTLGAVVLAVISGLVSRSVGIAAIVGSDIAHAVPLTLIAGLGHWWLGSVDWPLLISLLCGSIPGIVLGSFFSAYIPDKVPRPILAGTLLVVGMRLAF